MKSVIYVPITWVESLKMRLECLDKSFGTIRGITIEEFHRLKPAVEALTLESFALDGSCYPGCKGMAKEDVEHDIADLKRRFKEFEEHPELLGKDFQSIVYDDGWWDHIKDDKPPSADEFEMSNMWGNMWMWQSGTAAPERNENHSQRDRQGVT